eukprot:TRINITY_DN14075_c0_g1_i1.p2 TRINITY_DN14075_c0_g1~~TRINITY_DN14075_c0_g1_i1.p2  ORF type:complete len:101 (+),score=34.51 TRINITY_DN14075_c0_g1_i1:132-434(+)
MISKPSSLSKQFNECYPMAISEYKNDTWDDSSLDTEQSLDDAFQHLEKERLAALFKIFDEDLEEPGVVSMFQSPRAGPTDHDGPAHTHPQPHPEPDGSPC